MKKLVLAIAATGLMVPATPALAKHHGRHHTYQPRYQTASNGVRYWQGQDGRYYCKRSNGTTGLIIGAAAGALAGRAIDTRGERATGTILGAAAGALLGRQVQRGSVRCR
ncbi:glycine zipper 2TM domain-containing protein [Tsuneonella deserti]|uniref:glycine zipper 2TM domain-containing protein n=1 Tax=Tsuneonella deserti TaxID=2035528 RepID=UPI001E2BBE2B|nr:glycine zipper 2TM domain-containing protein [Tsuneonella deserti]